MKIHKLLMEKLKKCSECNQVKRCVYYTNGRFLFCVECANKIEQLKKKKDQEYDLVRNQQLNLEEENGKKQEESS